MYEEQGEVTSGGSRVWENVLAGLGGKEAGRGFGTFMYEADLNPPDDSVRWAFYPRSPGVDIGKVK